MPPVYDNVYKLATTAEEGKEQNGFLHQEGFQFKKVVIKLTQ